jgi:tetratricopeptide (TPR) repeat protein
MEHMNASLDTGLLKAQTLCKQGDDLASSRNFAGARDKYHEALACLPAEHLQIEVSTWIYAAIGETELALGESDKALECFGLAVQCPKGWGNPYIHLRLGQLHFDRGDEESAAVELIRAYKTGGIAVFMDGDPKYMEFLKAKEII